jgi:hypothetical protein
MVRLRTHRAVRLSSVESAIVAEFMTIESVGYDHVS